MTVTSANQDNGFFTVTVAATLVAASLIAAALLLLSSRSARLLERRSEQIRERYAAEALLVLTRQEIARSGLAVAAWDNAQRREVWDGYSVALRAIAGPVAGQGAEACLRALELSADMGPDDLYLIAGVQTDSGFRAQLAELISMRTDAPTPVLGRALLGGREARTCLEN